MTFKIGLLSHFVSFEKVILTGLLTTLVIISAIILDLWIKKRFSFKLQKKPYFIARFFLVLLSTLGIYVLTWPLLNLNNPQNGSIATHVSAILQPRFSFFHDSTVRYINGFIVDFTYNMRIEEMVRPEGYSKQAVSEIVQKYQKISNQENLKRVNPLKEDISFVFVMNESFFDPQNISSLYPYSGGDATPYLHCLASQENTVSTGSTFSPVYGGGTADVEFEALTGLSTSFLNLVPYNNVVSHANSFPSLVSYLNSLGYSTLGLHPAEGGMYKRDRVYDILGFDTFLDQKDFIHQEKNAHSDYISDKAAYAELFDWLKKSPSQLIFLVTMQNHIPYGNIHENHQFHSLANLTSKENLIIEDYLQCLNSSDVALGELFDKVDQLDQKVVLVFWGDHLPGIYPGFENTNSPLRQKTPLLLHANFPLKDSSSDIGTFTPNYIATTVLDYVNASKPAFYYLLDNVRESWPILVSNTGDITENLSKGTSSFMLNSTEALVSLHEYELIEYDIISGERYSEALGFFL